MNISPVKKLFPFLRLLQTYLAGLLIGATAGCQQFVPTPLDSLDNRPIFSLTQCSQTQEILKQVYDFLTSLESCFMPNMEGTPEKLSEREFVCRYSSENYVETKVNQARFIKNGTFCMNFESTESGWKIAKDQTYLDMTAASNGLIYGFPDERYHIPFQLLDPQHCPGVKKISLIYLFSGQQMTELGLWEIRPNSASDLFQLIGRTFHCPGVSEESPPPPEEPF